MKTILKTVVCAGVALMAAGAQAEGWKLTVGPSWRSRVKMHVRGSAAAPTAAASHTTTGYDRDVADWSAADVTETRPDYDVPGDELWAIGAGYTETTVTPGGGAGRVGGTDTEAPLGVKAKLGYDVWTAGDFAVSLDLRFAGYWNIRSSSAARAAGATTTTRTVTDWWLFKGGPYPDDRDFEFAPEPELDPRNREYGDTVVSQAAGRTLRARLEADLYQIGLGPTATWRAFEWLDVYAGAAALCNIASFDFEAGGSRSSDTLCRFGLAAEAGLAAYVTDNVGLYAEVGYEWIDRFSADGGGASARLDFSSLVVGAGLVVRW